MIEYDNGGRLVQDVAELPELRPHALYLDFETSSGSPDRDALSPWRDCSIAGVAVTCDAVSGAWYVPVGHHGGPNLPWEPVSAWLRDLLLAADEWANSNVKYDAHVALNAEVITFDQLARLRLLCTATLGKLVDSDRHRYGLEHLALDWLHEDISAPYEAMAPWLAKNKDYGAIPPDVMGRYACQDVLTNRRVLKYEREQLPEQCQRVWDTECAMTTVLVDVEREGMRVVRRDVMLRQLRTLERMLELEEAVSLTAGRNVRPHVNEDCHELLCGTYGLPVLGWTGEEPGEGNPSFDKRALAQYLAHPFAPRELVAQVMEYRKLHTLNSFFLAPFLELEQDGVLHPTYTQCVRTGRLACKEPNAQQQSPWSKELIVPPAGQVLCSWDYSQIEFRLIVHYIQNPAAIAAYLADPDTDFHVWVAQMCGVHRKPAKGINFMMGFGGGRKKTVQMLAANMELAAELAVQVDQLVAQGRVREEQRSAAFALLCEERAARVYSTYHRALPELKRTSYATQRVCEHRGYVFNLRGRHRHLPRWAAHKAFNNLNQSSAADIMKERTVALWRACRGTPVRLAGSVHDETVMHAPPEVVADPRFERDVTAILESPDVPLRVPLRVGFGWSARSWRAAGEASRPATRDTEGAQGLSWLRE